MDDSQTLLDILCCLLAAHLTTPSDPQLVNRLKRLDDLRIALLAEERTETPCDPPTDDVA